MQIKDRWKLNVQELTMWKSEWEIYQARGCSDSRKRWKVITYRRTERGRKWCGVPCGPLISPLNLLMRRHPPVSVAAQTQMVPYCECGIVSQINCMTPGQSSACSYILYLTFILLFLQLLLTILGALHVLCEHAWCGVCVALAWPSSCGDVKVVFK